MSIEESRRRLRESFLKVFASDEGQDVLQALECYAHADNADFINDPRKSDYMQGRRSVVCEIKKWIKEDWCDGE